METDAVCKGGSSSLKDTWKETCGDGIRLNSNTTYWDYGNLINGDGCSSTCTVESGSSFTGGDIFSSVLVINFSLSFVLIPLGYILVSIDVHYCLSIFPYYPSTLLHTCLRCCSNMFLHHSFFLLSTLQYSSLHNIRHVFLCHVVSHPSNILLYDILDLDILLIIASSSTESNNTVSTQNSLVSSVSLSKVVVRWRHVSKSCQQRKVRKWSCLKINKLKWMKTYNWRHQN